MVNADLQHFVESARIAQKQWAACSLEKRSAVLRKVSEKLVEHRDEIAATLTEEMHKVADEALADCDFSKGVLDFFADKAPEYLAPETIQHEGDFAKTRVTKLHFEPLGIIGMIKPWNFPLDTPLWAIAPALMAGNAVLLKPSPITPKTAQWIERLFTDAGAPVGLMQVLPSDDATGRALVEADIDMISFTGSSRVGKEVAKRCGERMIPFVLEMGGKDPAIVLPDCDIVQTAALIALHGTMNNGQCCTAIERVFVHESIYDEFVEALANEVRKRPTSRFASEDQFKIVCEHLQESIDKGASVMVGGHITDKAQWVLEPTLLACDTMDGAMWTEETFGPILPVYSVSSAEEAVMLANQSSYGLGASVWTRNNEEFQRIAAQLEVGMVWQNDANLPFNEGVWTGWKDSGRGYGLGKYGTRSFTKIKQVSGIKSE
jgi:acyl-CoA reductase-like NAD-dependent aldehyde dehydrogenase